jgi:hypothetical protein
VLLQAREGAADLAEYLLALRVREAKAKEHEDKWRKGLAIAGAVTREEYVAEDRGASCTARKKRSVRQNPTCKL